MNSVLYKAIILGLLLMFISAPFAGFAPLLLVVVIASIYWFTTSIVRVLVFGEHDTVDYQEEVIGKDN